MTSYRVAAFAMDGSLEGLGTWHRTALSPKWLTIATELVDAATRSGRAALPIEHLTHLTLRVSRAAGAMMVSYHVHGILATSTLLLTGDAPEIEAEVIKMFVQSLRGSPAVTRFQGAEPFGALFSLTERPLHVVVPWPQATISEDDQALVQELSTHVAGAVLTSSK